jgi:hypothetical protein
MLGEPGAKRIFWRRLWGTGVFLENVSSPGHSGDGQGENPRGVCHNHSVNTLPRAILMGKDKVPGVQGRAVLGEVS